MEIRVLRYFLAIAREGSITNAANVLHITQPTLSRQIHDLETELGQKLFTRGSHSMTLTTEGILLRKRAEEIISMVDKTKAAFHYSEHTIGGDIYIGSCETYTLKPVAQIAGKLRESYPGIRYHLYSGSPENITERLDQGLLDFGILTQPANISKYNSIDIPAKDTWGLIMRKDCLLAAKASIQKEDLQNIPLICSRQTISQELSGSKFAGWFGKDFEKLDIVTTYHLVSHAATMVDAGIGYAVIIDKLADTSENSSLCFRPLNPRLNSSLHIVWNKYQVFSSAAEIFLESLRQDFEN